ncbi:MAG: SoxR reducing system RseC family protein [Treponemataceae bacterium]
MEKKAKVTKVIKTEIDGTQLLQVRLDNKATIEQCTVREGKNFTSCETCKGCSHSGQTGLFAVSGDELEVLNTTGTRLSRGNEVLLSISKNAQKKEFLLAIILPTILAILGFVIFLQIFKTEALAILGAFAGLTLGVIISLIVKKHKGSANLPRVKRVL